MYGLGVFKICTPSDREFIRPHKLIKHPQKQINDYGPASNGVARVGVTRCGSLSGVTPKKQLVHIYMYNVD